MYVQPRKKLLVGLAGLIGALIVAGALTAIFGAGTSRHPRTRHLVSSPLSPPTTVPLVTVRTHLVAPATTVPAATPVQRQYDQDFIRGYSSPASKAMIAHAERLALPDPATGGGWRLLAVSNTPDGWASTFVRALFSIYFARQSRQALGAWLVAQEAPDLMPGIPAGFRYRSLYVSVIDPEIMDQARLIPTASQWHADAMARVRWTVSDLQVQLDPQWQSMIDAGWQPVDVRASLEDVSALLRITRGRTTTTRHLSLSVAVGSGRWHHGYGTVAITGQGG
jgi:hypothetical protein